MKDVHGNGIKPINKFHLSIHQTNPQPKKKKKKLERDRATEEREPEKRERD